MKKYSIIFLALICSGCTFAQGVLYAQHFANGLGDCKVVDNVGNAVMWSAAANPIDLPYIDGISSYPGQTAFFESQTAYNGFAIVNPIVNDTTPINNDLILPAINCSGQGQVYLYFSEWFNFYQATSQANIMVSTDSVSWTTAYNMRYYSNSENPQLCQFNISTYAANKPKVYIKFNFQTENENPWILDDIYVLSGPGNYIKADSVYSPDFVGINRPFPVSFMIENHSTTAQTLTSVVGSYSINNGPPVTQTFNNLSIFPFPQGPNIQILQFDSLATVSSVGTYLITVSASYPDSLNCISTVYDSVSKTLVSLSQVPARKVLLEESSGMSCVGCLPGTYWVDQIMHLSDSSFVIPVVLHLGDILSNSEGGTVSQFISAATMPTAAINREMLVPLQTDYPYVAIQSLWLNTSDTAGNDWLKYCQEFRQIISPASINMIHTYDPITRALSVTLTSTFYGPASGDFRMNCYITEDSVTGPLTDYFQINSYYDDSIPGNPLFGVGLLDTLDFRDAYVTDSPFNHVERMAMNGPLGDASNTGNIPATTADGGTYSQTYIAVLPGNWRDPFIKLVGFVSEYNSDNQSIHNIVFNAVSQPLLQGGKQPLSIQSTEQAFTTLRLFPNPANDYVTIDYSLNAPGIVSFSVYNSLGAQCISGAQQGQQGNNSIQLNTTPLSNGVYYVQASGAGGEPKVLEFILIR